jgi:hypothetical protein
LGFIGKTFGISLATVGALVWCNFLQGNSWSELLVTALIIVVNRVSSYAELYKLRRVDREQIWRDALIAAYFLGFGLFWFVSDRLSGKEVSDLKNIWAWY